MNSIFTQSIVAKKYEFNKPKIDGADYLLDKLINGCTKNYFHSFQ